MDADDLNRTGYHDYPEKGMLHNNANFDDHIYTTVISLFWLIGMPIILLLASVLWHVWTLMCDKVEATCSDQQFMIDYNTVNDCANPQVAKILSPLPPDFDFKHVCEHKSTKPGNFYARTIISV